MLAQFRAWQARQAARNRYYALNHELDDLKTHLDHAEDPAVRWDLIQRVGEVRQAMHDEHLAGWGPATDPTGEGR